MDPFLSNASELKRKGIPSLTLLAGVLIGVFLYHQWGMVAGNIGERRQVTPRAPIDGEEKRVVDTFESSAPSVVFITSKRRGSFFYREEAAQGSGSGFIWDEQGHVVTNFHVIQGGNRFEVVLHDQSSYEAEVVGFYADKDLAVLRIKIDRDRIRPLPLGSTEQLAVGQRVLAIGNPFGLDQTLTTGVVSALNRTIPSVNNRKISGVIQTDAAINPGNSGGPLLDSAGRLIGVNTQIYSTSGSSAGIGFAIPVDTVNDVVPQLIRFGKVSRPGLGFYPIHNNSRVMRYLGKQGLMIQDVTPGGSADRAGLRGVRVARDGSTLLGDIIVQVDGQKIRGLQELTDVLDRHRVGDEVEVTVLRNNRNVTVKMKLQAIN